MSTPSASKPRQRRRGAERDELREQILRAVSKLHDEGGYGAVTMRGVADAVGISAMSLYRYFPSKGVLLESVWAEVLEDSLTVARMRCRPTDPPLQRLRSLYEAYAQFWMARPLDFKFVFDPCNAISPGFLATGPASGFRRECETLIDACLGPAAGVAQREAAYDLCRLKIIGLLFTTVGLATKPRTSQPALLRAMLDDIEQQLLRARAAADAQA
jgi:AcrR family transcriptional regulator